MMTRSSLMIAALTCGAFLGSVRIVSSKIVHNTTESLPLGFYWVSDRAPKIGDLVVLETPPYVKQLVHDRHYLPEGDRLLKQVVAGPDTLWCVQEDNQFNVDGALWGEAFRADSNGLPLPQIRGCFFVPTGHVLVATHHPRSFDSRYFGAVPSESLVGVAEAIWTYSH